MTTQKTVLLKLAELFMIHSSVVEELDTTCDLTDVNFQNVIRKNAEAVISFADADGDVVLTARSQRIMPCTLLDNVVNVAVLCSTNPSMTGSSLMPLSVYRSEHDCSLDGVTSRYKRLYGQNLSPTHVKALDHMIIHGIADVLVYGKAGGAVHYKPAEIVISGKWGMFGGNFVYTSDSRMDHDHPVKVHDRVES